MSGEPVSNAAATSEMPPAAVYRETEDAELFALVHEALKSSGLADDDERRESRRAEYQCQQLLAPFAGGELPQQWQFAHVLCHDLSCTGFSYVSAQEPSTDRVVIALGRAPFKFFFAKVMHHRELDDDSAGQYLVGCRFSARLEE